jgi:hypothetical protein
MNERFDPYYQWLGIPPHLQPANHYRLLGVELFESNADVIGVAADRQMAHVRTYQLGEYSDISQELLNELAAAKMCLLLPERKAVYDATLRLTLTLTASAAPSSPKSHSTGYLPGAPPDDEELDLVPEKPAHASHASHHRAAVGTTRSDEGSPSSIGTRKSKPAPAAAPKPLLAAMPDDLPSPVVPWPHEPPFLTENRRRLLETLTKVGIFVFLLVLAVMLFNAFALPWIRTTFAPQENPPSAPPTPPTAESHHHPLPPPPVPMNDGTENRADLSRKAMPPPRDATPEENRASAGERSVGPIISEQPSGEEFFIGRWHIYENQRYVSTITLGNDHSARDSHHPSEVGTWEYKNQEARVLWKDGWRVVLRREGADVRKFALTPDDAAGERPVDEGTATRDAPADGGKTRS